MDFYAPYISASNKQTPKNYTEALALARLFKDTDWKKALDNYLRAHAMAPTQLEPFIEIAEYYRCKGENLISNTFARMAYLFSSASTSIEIKLRIYFEFLVTSYYVDRKEEGLLASDRLIFNRTIHSGMKNQTFINQMYYIPLLENLHIHSIEFESPLVEDPCEEYEEQRYRLSNPCIVKDKNGYIALVRCVNFLNDQPVVIFYCKHKIVKSRTHIVRLDKNLQILFCNEINETLPRKQFICRYQGLEDCRMFRNESIENSPWYAIVTTADTNQKNLPKLSIARFKNEQGEIDLFTTLDGPYPDKIEKNWMPFFHKNEIYAIYGYDPFIIYKFDINTGKYETIVSYIPEIDLTRLRGSAPPISYEINDEQGYLLITHEVIIFGEYNYYHRFVWINKNFRIQKISHPFYFKLRGFEFCAGMCHMHDEDCVFVSTGVRDREALVYKVENTKIRKMLKNIDEYVI